MGISILPVLGLILFCIFFPCAESSAKQSKSQSRISQKQSSYRVAKGDSWWGIAKKFKTNPAELARTNGRKETEALFERELLKIPGASSSPSPIPRLAEKPSFPIASKTSVAKPFSELSYDPNKGQVFQKGTSNLVQATLSGKVVHIDFMDGYENYLVLEHENGYYSVYGNLEKIQVVEGQMVKKQDRLGILSKNKGLYFQINKNKTVMNPKSFLELGT
ncbi:LysM peptidoglycan-binding domain-containing M23 family metallopeptidase [Leptospira sp. 96542]|nr:LysM peptidoglycan-binding domain-containing M23 family metallopeptidase [Leptospira sp. 96542]